MTSMATPATSGAWSGLANKAVSMRTNSSGVASIGSPAVRARGVFIFSVSNVTANNCTYNSSLSAVTSSAIATP